MNNKIDAAIEKLADQTKANQDSQKALHFSQALLNLAHAKQILTSCGKKVAGA